MAVLQTQTRHSTPLASLPNALPCPQARPRLLEVRLRTLGQHNQVGSGGQLQSWELPAFLDCLGQINFPSMHLCANQSVYIICAREAVLTLALNWRSHFRPDRETLQLKKNNQFSQEVQFNGRSILVEEVAGDGVGTEAAPGKLG
jgi:hypothetical protein